MASDAEEETSLYEDSRSQGWSKRLNNGFAEENEGQYPRTDYVLVYNMSKASQDEERRNFFEDHLEDEGLQLDRVIEDVDGKKYCFVLIHAPWDFLIRQAEVLKMRMPVRENDLHVRNPKRGWLSTLWRWTIVADTENRHYFTALFRRDKLDQFMIENQETFFTSAQRSYMVFDILARTEFDVQRRTDCGILRLLNAGTYCAAYPLHEGPHVSECDKPLSDRQELFRRWANIKRWWDYQPYDLIRRYFGEKIALYFVWLGHYTVCLFPISILGILCVVYGFWTLNTDIPSKEICNGPASDLMMCPNCDVGCDFWKLGSSCTYARVTHLFDNGCTVLFAALMSLWATLFLEAWKRRQGELSWRWNLCDFDLEEDVIRPEFEICAKKMKLNPITQEMEPHLPFSERVLRLIASSVTVLFCLCLVLAFTFSIILYRIIVSHHFDRHETTYVRTNASVVASFSAALLNLLIVMILDQAYAKLAWRLTNWEFPRTESEFENSYTFKVFLFQFINYYSSLFYIAFFKGRFAKLPGPTEDTILGYRPEACDPNGCMVELLIQLAIIMVGKQFINNVMEIGVPMMYNYLRKKKSTGTAALTSAMAWARDFLLNPVPQDFLLGEYLEMILQYGFVTLFVAAFPLAPAFALLNNIIEVRLDAYKYVVTYRRPLPSRTKDLGVWMHILVGISRMAVLTNACVIAFTSDFVPRMVYRHLFSTNSSLEGFVGGELSMFNPFSFCRDNNMSIACNLTSCRYEDYRKPPCTANPYATLDRWSPEFPMVLSNRTLWPSTGFEDCDDSYSTNTKWWIVLAMRILFVLLFENLVFTVKMLFEWFVPDLPFKVHVQIQREKYLAKQALYDNAFKEQSPKHLSRRHKRNKE
uniref:Anoctamin n=1 Tax=Trichuris muris TaxID=70415 RepID=A0A5S6QAG6_TRIMR